MEVKSIKTEDRIINATLLLLDEVGISDITTKKIADEAGVSEVTIFRKFKSKNNLLKIAKKSYTAYFLDKLDDIFKYRETNDLDFYFESIWLDLTSLLDDHLNIIKISMDELREKSKDDKVLSLISNKIIEDLTYIFQKLIDEEKIRKINPKVAAITVFGVIFEGIILLKLYDEDSNKDINQYAEDFLDIFINGFIN